MLVVETSHNFNVLIFGDKFMTTKKKGQKTYTYEIIQYKTFFSSKIIKNNPSKNGNA